MKSTPLIRVREDGSELEVERLVGNDQYHDWYIGMEFLFDNLNFDPIACSNLAFITDEFTKNFGLEAFFEAKLPDRTLILINPKNEAAVRTAEKMTFYLESNNILLGAEDYYLEQIRELASSWWIGLLYGERLCLILDQGGDTRDAFGNDCPDCLLENYALEEDIPFPKTPDENKVLDSRDYGPYLVVFDDSRQHTMMNLDGLKKIVTDMGSWLRFFNMLKGGHPALMVVNDPSTKEIICNIKVITDNSPKRPSEPEYATM